MNIAIIEYNYAGNMKHFFEKANKIKNGFKPRTTIIIIGENGSLVSNREDRSGKWVQKRAMWKNDYSLIIPREPYSRWSLTINKYT